MEDIRVYNPFHYLNEIKHTSRFQKLLDKYDYITVTDHKLMDGTFVTIRDLMHNRSFNIEVLYYLDIVLDNDNTSTVYDLGCGSNYLKEFYPNIIGIDASNESADIIEKINTPFVKKYEGSMDKIIANNSLHFRSIYEYSKIITWMYDLLKPGGRAFIALSVSRLVDGAEDDRPNSEYYKYILDETNELKQQMNIILFEFFPAMERKMNGDIRLIIQKD